MNRESKREVAQRAKPAPQPWGRGQREHCRWTLLPSWGLDRTDAQNFAQKYFRMMNQPSELTRRYRAVRGVSTGGRDDHKGEKRWANLDVAARTRIVGEREDIERKWEVELEKCSSEKDKAGSYATCLAPNFCWESELMFGLQALSKEKAAIGCGMEFREFQLRSISMSDWRCADVSRGAVCTCRMLIGQTQHTAPLFSGHFDMIVGQRRVLQGTSINPGTTLAMRMLQQRAQPVWRWVTKSLFACAPSTCFMIWYIVMSRVSRHISRIENENIFYQIFVQC
jgi:hypothetical protein